MSIELNEPYIIFVVVKIAGAAEIYKLTVDSLVTVIKCIFE